MSDDFGLFLGFTTVLVRPPLDDLEQLIRSIAAQNAWQKCHRTAERELAAHGGGTGAGADSLTRTATLLLSQIHADGGGDLERKYEPLVGRRHFPSPLMNYIRVSPTGPMLPLVFTTTTLGNRFHVALTRRDDLIDDPRAAALVSTFIEQLGVAAAWK